MEKKDTHTPQQSVETAGHEDTKGTRDLGATARWASQLSKDRIAALEAREERRREIEALMQPDGVSEAAIRAAAVKHARKHGLVDIRKPRGAD
ncbi:MAG: hypothetical protein Q4B05_03465 [Candidatus Saccharibacteria bacterium]|nr:hypothetical protein [Candidatus Saccharibacteria bacterium]